MWLLALLWLLIVMAALLWYSGIFTQITCRVGAASLQGSLSIRYKFGAGTYWTVGSQIRELQQLLPKDVCLIGIYYDDPKKTSECRWAVGVLTSATNRKPLNDLYTNQLTNWGYQTWEMPSIDRAVISTHPWTIMLSVFVAPWRVYPAITRFVKAKKLQAYPAIELYEHGQIEYCMPLHNQAAYYVPQVEAPDAEHE